jgi:hypothetical protein
VFYPNIFFLSSRRGEKKSQRKKNMQKKGRSLPSSSCFALSLLAHISAFSLLHFYFKRFFLVSSFSQAKKKKTQKKKLIEKKKNANKGRSLLSSFRFALSFLAPTSALSFQALSPNIFFFSNKRKKKHNEKKTIKKKKMQKKEGTYLFSNKKKKKT